MSISGRSFISFPALIIGIGLALVFFKLYGRMTRPDVPTPVSATIEHFAPGVAIGATVDEASKKVSGLRWVDNLGYIGKPAAPTFNEVRIIPKRDKGRLIADRDAKVERVELVAFREDNMYYIMRDLTIAFQSPTYNEGCLEPVGDGYPYRQVRYFTTKRDLGGVAVITDWRQKDTLPPSYIPPPQDSLKTRYERLYARDTTPHPWTMMTWTGKFAGSSTLKADYQPVPCLNLVGK